MRKSKISPIRLIFSLFLFFLAVSVLIVFVFSSEEKPFHGLIPAMERQTILNLRTAFAGLCILLFFPIVALLSRRRAAGETQRLKLALWASTLAEIPAVLGLVLFLLKGAFKTFFLFLAVSAVYLLFSWPQE